MKDVIGWSNRRTKDSDNWYWFTDTVMFALSAISITTDLLESTVYSQSFWTSLVFGIPDHAPPFSTEKPEPYFLE